MVAILQKKIICYHTPINIYCKNIDILQSVS